MSDKTETQLPPDGGSTPRACSGSSDTPETDHAEIYCAFEGQLLEVCRKIERERNQLMEALQCALADLELTAGLTSTTRGCIRHRSIATVRNALLAVTGQNDQGMGRRDGRPPQEDG